MKCMIINGPNLNMLEYRNKKDYGSQNLEELEEILDSFLKFKKVEIKIEIYQTNYEGKFIDLIQKAVLENYDYLIVNPAAYSHTSIGIMDALLMFHKKKAEVHISKPSMREDFRRIFLTGKAVDFIIEGMGLEGYKMALSKMIKQENNE